jgi:hypothetical protein
VYKIVVVDVSVSVTITTVAVGGGDVFSWLAQVELMPTVAVMVQVDISLTLDELLYGPCSRLVWLHNRISENVPSRK